MQQMENQNIDRIQPQLLGTRQPGLTEIRHELFRKGIHLLIAFVPPMASINLFATFILLGVGTLVYCTTELLRFNGIRVPVISSITEYASRKRDAGKIVLGPATLGIGAMAALFFYPDPAASLAIYALAFGDGLSSVFGKLYGRVTIPFSREKTYMGSISCFIAVFLFSLAVVKNPVLAFITAVSATLLEALPLKDLDNIVIPLGTGFVVYLYLII